jgi:phosphate-selective porin
MFTSKLEGLLRYDYLNADRDGAGDTSVRDLILGLNYYLKGNTKIQANLIRRDGAHDLAGASSVTNPHSDIHNDRTELRTSVQVAF